MEEYKIIKTLESFQQGKPNPNWANFAKQDITSKSFQKTSVSFMEAYSLFRSSFNSSKLAVGASLSAFLIVFLIIVVSTNYSPNFGPMAINKPLSPEEKLIAAISATELELNKIPLAPKDSGEVGVQEFKLEAKKALASASEQMKNLSEDQKVAFADSVVTKVKALEKNANTVIMDEDEDNTAIKEFYKIIAENEIKEIEENIKNLTDGQRVILSNAKDFFAVGDYNKALEEIYKIQPATDSNGKENNSSQK